jgi:hypothetical protein
MSNLNLDSNIQGTENKTIAKKPKNILDIAASLCSEVVAKPALKLAAAISKITIAKKTK